jgi:HEAT repeat protein
MGFLGLFGPNVEKLRRKGDALGLVIAMRDPNVREEAGAALLSLGEAALPAALAGMRDAEGHADEHDQILVSAAVQAGAAAVEPVMQLAAEGSDQAKRRALTALGRLGDRRAVPAIRSALRESTDWVRSSALNALVALTGREDVDVVMESLSDSSALVKNEAARLLGQVGDPAAIPALRSLWGQVGSLDLTTATADRVEGLLGRDVAIEDPQARLMMAAWRRSVFFFNIAGSLAVLGDAGAREALFSAVRKTDSPGSRLNAIEQLGRLGGEAAMVLLAEALRDPDKNVRWEAIKALGATPDPNGSRMLEQARGAASWDDRERIAKALARRG